MDIMMDMDMLGHVTCCYIYVLWFCMGMCYVCAAYAVLLCVGGVAARPKKAVLALSTVFYFVFTRRAPRRLTHLEFLEADFAAAPAPGRTPR